MSNLKWLEVLHASVKNQLKSKEDCLTAVLHCLMLNKGCKCIGIGDSWDQASDSPTELLPEGWNSNQEMYTLRYITATNVKYLVKIVKTSNSLLVNLLDVKRSRAAGMSLVTMDHVDTNFKVFSTAYKNLEKIENDFEINIVKVIKLGEIDKPSSEKDKAKSSKTIPDDPLIEERYNFPYTSGIPVRNPTVGFPSIGRNDLDPLGGFGGIPSGGGGMLLDPRTMSRRPDMPDLGIGAPGPLPRGAIPPGARFDPFGPPTRGRGSSGYDPNPDDDLPPGFGDSFI